MCWQLILEEYGSTFEYIKGKKNIVADALSHLNMEASSETPARYKELLLANTCFTLTKEDIPDDAYPLTMKNICRAQHNDKTLVEKLRKDAPGYSLTAFRGGGKTREVITYNGKIYVPSRLQKRCVEWYHMILCHPGELRTEQTIRMHYYWPNMRQLVVDIC